MFRERLAIRKGLGAALVSLALTACGGGGGGSGGGEDTRPTISIANSGIVEGDAGTVDLTFTVTLSAQPNGDVNIDYATANGRAAGGAACGNGVDYVSASGTLTVPAASTSATFAVEVCGDADFEPNETFTVTLSHVSANALLGSETATGTIANDDPGGLNDTGITTCSGADTTDSDCPVVGYPNQDAEHGRDVTQNEDGDGHAGFTFTKIGRDGRPLAVQNGTWDELGSEAAGTKWSCVLDNVTGLMWEVKTDDGGLHDWGWSYTWYNSDNSTNGGSAGTPNGGDCLGGNDCDTEKFVAAVNADRLCGSGDWRLPTREELGSLVAYDYRKNGAIDTAWFPNTHPFEGGEGFSFWSASPYANDIDEAWKIDSETGVQRMSAKFFASPVRLVRGSTGVAW